MAVNFINTSTTVADIATLAHANTLTIIATGATRVSTGDHGLSNLSTSDNCDVRVLGTLIGDYSGAWLNSNGTTDDHLLTVGQTGFVFGYLGQGAYVAGVGATVVNHGKIGSEGNAGAYVFGDSCVVKNYGDIYSLENYGVTLVGADARLENHGTITSSTLTAVLLRSTTGTYVMNTGTIIGMSAAIRGSDAGDLIVNQGVILGSILTRDGDDVLAGTGGGAVDANGGNGLDTLRGSRFDDILGGEADADRLIGNAGDDLIYGGGGTDFLRGGAGEDQFVFSTLAEMGNAIFSDTIAGFVSGEDVINLGAIPGLTFIGSAAFGSVALQVRYARATGQVQIDENGDGGGDFFLQLKPGTVVVAGDLIL